VIAGLVGPAGYKGHPGATGATGPIRLGPLVIFSLYLFHALIKSNVSRWWLGTVVERRSLTGELSLSCARPAADG